MNDFVGELVRCTSAAIYPTGVTGQQVEECNVFMVCNAAGGGDSRLALASAIDGLWAAAYLSKLYTTTKYYGTKVSVQNIHPPPAPIATIANLPGTGSNGVLPTQVRGLIRWQTLIGGRTGRGRIFAFTPDVNQQDPSGSPVAGYKTAMQAVANGYLSGFTVAGSTWALVVAHRGAAHPPSYTFNLAAGNQVFPGFATQRRSGETGRVNILPW